MPYATPQDLAEYLGTDPSQLPADVERLLERASELVDYLTLGCVDPSNPEHLEAVKKATCAQVEAWMQTDEVGDKQGTVKRFTIGRFSMDFGEQGVPQVAPRARRYLLLAGLLYRGVQMR